MSAISTCSYRGRLVNARPGRRRELSKAKSVATSLRSRCWVGSITSTNWPHDHPDWSFCAPQHQCSRRSSSMGAEELAQSQKFRAVIHRLSRPRQVWIADDRARPSGVGQAVAATAHPLQIAGLSQIGGYCSAQYARRQACRRAPSPAYGRRSRFEIADPLVNPVIVGTGAGSKLVRLQDGQFPRFVLSHRFLQLHPSARPKAILVSRAYSLKKGRGCMSAITISALFSPALLRCSRSNRAQGSGARSRHPPPVAILQQLSAPNRRLQHRIDLVAPHHSPEQAPEIGLGDHGYGNGGAGGKADVTILPSHHCRRCRLP